MELAQNILETGQTTPALVREDGGRFVLVEGLYRFETCKSLGEETIRAFLVQARRHKICRQCPTLGRLKLILD